MRLEIFLVILGIFVHKSVSIIGDVPPPTICEIYDPNNCSGSSIEACTTTKACPIDSSHDRPNNCFVLWKEDTPGNVTVTMKGCFTENQACNQSECINVDSATKNNIKFCCCSGSLCNREHKWVPATTPIPDVVPTQAPKTSNEKLIIGLVILVIAAIILTPLTIYLIVKYRHSSFNQIPLNDPEATDSGPSCELMSIKLIEMKAQGRFGTVWKAQMRPEEVAVKIFPMQDKQSWATEMEIFKLPRMKHPNILQFIGADKFPDNGEHKLWLITAYHSNGSLCDYLKSHTVTWPELCKIAESMARGLMHLHEEIPASKTDGLKPAIAHRDFKSKNVLLKDDLTACIADFGLALVFKPGEPCGDTHGQVGTRRYMAPEILEGAINFTRDAFLRIDVYACGLVLWELVSRCTSHGGIVSDYTLPFEIEIGPHPSLEEMQENIVTKKIRPNIQEHWRNHKGLNAICETMEECWDHDAEARLSASCVMERVSQHIKYPSTQLHIETNNPVTHNKDVSDST
uniref:Serine/threonine-protein kinase receptor n=1 Tax=Culicoides sonorensis TaxID=179676 RepID=A0A336LB80_CULSO